MMEEMKEIAKQAGVEAFWVELESDIVLEEVKGVRIAVDEVYALTVNGERYGEIVAMPANLEEVALGLVLSEPGMGDPGDASISTGKGWIRINAKGTPAKPISFEGCSPQRLEVGSVTHNEYSWSDVYAVYGDFASKTGSTLYRIPVHTTGIYDLIDRRAVIAHDTSRHTAVLKAIGLAYKAGLLVGRRRLAAITTGRASSDMITRLAAIGVGLIIAMRGPLSSGLNAARRVGVVLVSNARQEKGRSLVLLSGSLA